MTGVTTIAEHVVKDYGAECLVISIICGIGAIIVLAMACHYIKDCVDMCFDPFDWLVLAIMSLAFLCFGAMCIISAKGYADKSTHMEYSVTIDDTASFNEVNRTYDILSEEDGVYRVKLKEDAQ